MKFADYKESCLSLYHKWCRYIVTKDKVKNLKEGPMKDYLLKDTQRDGEQITNSLCEVEAAWQLTPGNKGLK